MREEGHRPTAETLQGAPLPSCAESPCAQGPGANEPSFEKLGSFPCESGQHLVSSDSAALDLARPCNKSVAVRFDPKVVTDPPAAQRSDAPLPFDSDAEGLACAPVAPQGAPTAQHTEDTCAPLSIVASLT